MLNFSQTTIYSSFCVVLPCLIYFIIKRRKNSKSYWIFVLLFVLYLWQVYDLTGVGGLTDIIYAPKGGIDQPIIRARINLVPFTNIEKTFYLNILMLIPFGFLVPHIWKNYRKAYKTAILGAGFSLLIELSQLITTRTTDIDDLITNTLGALLGFIIWKIFFKNHLKETENSKRDVIVYILLSFLGMFFLYYPFWFSDNIASIILG